MLVAGLAVGGGAAFATSLLIGPKPAEAPQPPRATAADRHYVAGGKLLVPLALKDGRLAGYVSIEFSLDIAPEQEEFVTARLPLLLHGINMRTWRTPLAAGPDGLLLDVNAFRKVVDQAAPEAFGRGIVRSVAVTGATPA
jgi:hypothetical protein